MTNTSEHKSYYLVMEQKNQGCDYTIGCGTTIEPIRATTMEEAIEEAIGIGADWQDHIDQISSKHKNVKDYVHDYFLCYSNLRYVNDKERPMSSIDILEVSNTVSMLPLLKDKLEEVNAYVAKLGQKTQDNEEKQLYETLKKKYG